VPVKGSTVCKPSANVISGVATMLVAISNSNNFLCFIIWVIIH